MIVKLHPDAEVDVNEAQQWYAQRSAIAARAFLTEFITAVDCILQLPEACPRYLAGTRRYFLPTFPFSLVYRVDGDIITIVAIAHHRRKPGYWRNRH